MTAMAPKAEITSADVDRVDAVDEPATGLPYIMLKSTTGPTADPANVPEAEPVAKAEGDGEDGDEPTAGDQTVDPLDPAAEADPGSAPWEAVDAANAREAVSGLLAIRSLIGFLSEREAAEGDDDCAVWDLEDAKWAVESALRILALFAATEQQEADDAAAEAEAQARALGLIKSLNLTKEEPAMATEPTKAELLKSLEADTIAKAQEAGIEDASLMGLFVRKAQEDDLPVGVIDLLNQIVAVMNAIDDVSTGATEAAESPVDTGEGDQAEDIAPAQPDAGPIEDAAAPAEPAAPAAPATDGDTAPADAPAAAPVDGTDEKKPNPFAKSQDEIAKAAREAVDARMSSYLSAVDAHRTANGLPSVAVAKAAEVPLEDRIAAAVASAVAAATEPLKKRITELEETPVETGVLLSGHVPGTLIPNTGQGKADTPQAELLKSAAMSGDPGKQMDAVVEALKGSRRGRTF